MVFWRVKIKKKRKLKGYEVVDRKIENIKVENNIY